MSSRIVVASSCTLGREIFSSLGETLVLPEQSINAAAVRDAEILVTRSKVKIDRSLLEGSRLQFYGTCTAGVDHVDAAYLAQRQIAWTAAPGCNADSVAEYVVSALLCLGDRHGFELAGKTLAVIGVGQVGRRVTQRGLALGLKPLVNDPPLQHVGAPIAGAGLSEAQAQGLDWAGLAEILPQADIVTFHVPLVENGLFPTRNLANGRFFELLKPGCVFVNASRGEIVDESALLLALDHGIVAHAVLDVFQNEPRISPVLLERADIASPHVAGHSYEGKANGTIMVYREACHFLEVEETWAPDAAVAGAIDLEAKGLSVEEALWRIVRQVYNPEADDAALRRGEGDLATRFNRLRNHYPERHEFRLHRVCWQHGPAGLRARLEALGFQLDPG